MSKSFDELAVFSSLKPLLVPFEKNLTVVTDDETSYYLDTRHIMKNKKPLFFGAVQIKKNYVSFHLMPVYVNPSLLDSMSAELGKRMRGKSCFNFKNVDHNLIKELKALTQAGYQFYVEENYI